MSDSANSAAPEAKPPRRQFFAALVAAIAGVGLIGSSRRAAAAPQSSQPFVGEVMLFAGNFAPLGWLACEGQLLSIAENETLFALLGTTYGGDGQSTFGLPDLRGRTPIHAGQGPGLSAYTLGEMSGSELVTLSTGQLPAHPHTAMGDAAAGSSALRQRRHELLVDRRGIHRNARRRSGAIARCGGLPWREGNRFCRLGLLRLGRGLFGRIGWFLGHDVRSLVFLRSACPLVERLLFI